MSNINNNIFLSYLITTHNEDSSLYKLLNNLIKFKHVNSEIIILDDYSSNTLTLDIFNEFKSHIKVYKHKLNLNFSNHKNYGITLCDGKWIFHLDADEYIPDTFIFNINEIIKENSKCDLIYVPRLNHISDITEEILSEWNASITTLDNIIWEDQFDITSSTYKLLQKNKLIISETEQCNENNLVKIKYYPIFIYYPDYQGRIFKNKPNIKYIDKLHEHIIGFDKYTLIPQKTPLNILHIKTLKQQKKQLEFYKKNFSIEDNKVKPINKY